MLTTDSFTLGGGMDLLVAGLQLFSYPFHDPVLTDRGFVNHEKTMLLGRLPDPVASHIGTVRKPGACLTQCLDYGERTG